jgi:hypothetical protein
VTMAVTPMSHMVENPMLTSERVPSLIGVPPVSLQSASRESNACHARDVGLRPQYQCVVHVPRERA